MRRDIANRNFASDAPVMTDRVPSFSWSPFVFGESFVWEVFTAIVQGHSLVKRARAHRFARLPACMRRGVDVRLQSSVVLGQIHAIRVCVTSKKVNKLVSLVHELLLRVVHLGAKSVDTTRRRCRMSPPIGKDRKPVAVCQRTSVHRRISRNARRLYRARVTVAPSFDYIEGTRQERLVICALTWEIFFVRAFCSEGSVVLVAFSVFVWYALGGGDLGGGDGGQIV